MPKRAASLIILLTKPPFERALASQAKTSAGMSRYR